jgi:hypothetical protein
LKFKFLRVSPIQIPTYNISPFCFFLLTSSKTSDEFSNLESRNKTACLEVWNSRSSEYPQYKFRLRMGKWKFCSANFIIGQTWLVIWGSGTKLRNSRFWGYTLADLIFQFSDQKFVRFWSKIAFRNFSSKFHPHFPASWIRLWSNVLCQVSEILKHSFD